MLSLPRLLPATGVGLGGAGTEWLSEEASAEEPVPDAVADPWPSPALFFIRQCRLRR
jgi:hypothetical protein